MAHAADAHDSHGAQSHGEHGHGADVADGPTSGPFGWPFALVVGLATLAVTLWALLAPR